MLYALNSGLMSGAIQIKQSLPIRARPEILYRLVLDPHRHALWDSNLESAAYEGENTRLGNNAIVNFRLPRKYLGLRFQARYSHIQTSRGGTWQSVGQVGPLESLRQQWNFKAVPGGTEVTLTLDASVRYNWTYRQLERLLQNMVMSTLLDLQRAVDAPAAQQLEQMGREMQAKQQAEEKAAKAAAKAARVPGP